MDLINNVAAAEQDVVSAIDAARPSFWLTIVAHTTLFCLGVGLLAFGVSGLWFGTDWLAVLFAAGGIGATFSVLLRAPVRGLQQSIATRIQLELIANGYRKEIAIWKSYAAFSDRQDDPLSVDSVVSSQIRRSAARALALIEAYCEPLGTSKIRYKRRWDRHLHRLAQVGPVSTNHYPFERPAIQPMPAGKIASDKRPEKTMTEKMMTEKMRPDKSPLEQIPRPLPEMEAPRTGPDEQPPGKIPFILAIPHEPPAGPPDR
jgi:hypothetical protein